MQAGTLGAIRVGEKLIHLAKRRSDIGREVGIHHNHGTARVCEGGEVKGFKRMRSQDQIGRCGRVNRPAFGQERRRQRTDIVEEDVERRVCEPAHSEHRLHERLL